MSTHDHQQPARVPANGAPQAERRISPPIHMKAPLRADALSDADGVVLADRDHAPFGARIGGLDAEVVPQMRTSEPSRVRRESHAIREQALIVEDDAVDLADGQARRTEYLDRLEQAVISQTHEALRGTQWTPENCPWIAYWFSYYRGQSGEHLERAVLRYVPEAARAATADEYVALAAARINRGMQRFLINGMIGDVPNGAPEALPAGVTWKEIMDAARDRRQDFRARMDAAKLRERLENVPENAPEPAAASDGATHTAASTAVELGDGRPMEPQVRARLSEAFGEELPEVRVHDDAAGARIAAREDARALAVGGHIAFAAGAYQPGTPLGDGLIAHEMAHVLQQQGAEEEESPAAYNAAERDAERSTIGVLRRMWAGMRGLARDVRENAKPALKSGLALQRCGREEPDFVPEDAIQIALRRLNGKEEVLRKVIEYEEALARNGLVLGNRLRTAIPRSYDPLKTSDINELGSKLGDLLSRENFSGLDDFLNATNTIESYIEREAQQVALKMIAESEQVVRSEQLRYISEKSPAVQKLWNELAPIRAMKQKSPGDRYAGDYVENVSDPKKERSWDNLAARHLYFDEDVRAEIVKGSSTYPVLQSHYIQPERVSYEDSPAELSQYLEGVLEKHQSDAVDAREYLKKDPKLIWKLEPVIQRLKREKAIPDNSIIDLIIHDKQERVDVDAAAHALIVAVLMITLGWAGKVGGLIGTAIGVKSVADEYSDIQQGSAFSGTDLRQQQSLSKERPGYGQFLIDLGLTFLDLKGAFRKAPSIHEPTAPKGTTDVGSAASEEGATVTEEAAASAKKDPATSTLEDTREKADAKATSSEQPAESKSPAGLLTSSKRLDDHHIFPQTFKKFFASRGINIDEFSITVDKVTTHLKAIHGKGNLGQMPGRWNKIWQEWIESHPNATAKDIYQQAGKMMDDFRINDMRIHPYRK